MKFSIVIPAFEEEEAFARTLSNIISQRSTEIKREIIVVTDGPISSLRKITKYCERMIKETKQDKDVEIKHLSTDKRNGTGNIGRELGIKAATGDYVMFLDSGCCLLAGAFFLMEKRLALNPNPDIILWDIIQMVDPAPFAQHCLVVEPLIQSGANIGYYIPGVAAAVKTDIAKSEPWPNVKESDWAWWGKIWEKLPRPINALLLMYPIVIAYAGYSWKRNRVPVDWETATALGYHKTFEERYGPEKSVQDRTDKTA